MVYCASCKAWVNYQKCRVLSKTSGILGKRNVFSNADSSICHFWAGTKMLREESARAGTLLLRQGRGGAATAARSVPSYAGFSRRGRPQSFWRCPRLRSAHTSGLALTPVKFLELSVATKLFPSHPPSLSEVVVPSATWSLASHSQRLCHLRRTSSFIG